MVFHSGNELFHSATIYAAVHLLVVSLITSPPMHTNIACVFILPKQFFHYTSNFNVVWLETCGQIPLVVVVTQHLAYCVECRPVMVPATHVMLFRSMSTVTALFVEFK